MMLVPYTRKNHSIYNPFHDFDELERAFFSDNSLTEFKTDIRDNGKEYLLEADLPGFKKEDIHVDVEGDYLTITASRNYNKEEKDEKNNYVRRERSYGSFARSFDVSGIKTEDISVEYTDGVLKLNLPKREAEKPSSRRLEIK